MNQRSYRAWSRTASESKSAAERKKMNFTMTNTCKNTADLVRKGLSESLGLDFGAGGCVVLVIPKRKRCSINLADLSRTCSCAGGSFVSHRFNLEIHGELVVSFPEFQAILIFGNFTDNESKGLFRIYVSC